MLRHREQGLAGLGLGRSIVLDRSLGPNVVPVLVEVSFGAVVEEVALPMINDHLLGLALLVTQLFEAPLFLLGTGLHFAGADFGGDVEGAALGVADVAAGS